MVRLLYGLERLPEISKSLSHCSSSCEQKKINCWDQEESKELKKHRHRKESFIGRLQSHSKAI
jgi:hypothetical protein